MRSSEIPPRPHPAPDRVTSFTHAFDGWRFMLRTTPNAWIHLTFTLAVIVMGVWLRISLLSWAVLVLAMGLVWVAEFINTAVEFTVDIASPEINSLAKIAKDVAAAAVLTAAGIAVIVGLLVLGPPLLLRLAALLG